MAGNKPKFQYNDLGPVTTGYIMIPTQIDRDSYIETCYRTNKVCVLVEGGLFKTDVYITNEAIQNIQFPEEPGEKGTQVVIASGAFRNQPIIIGTLQGNDEIFAWSEEIQRFRKTSEDTDMLFCMDPINREWNLNLVGKSKPINLNITMGGNVEHKIRLQSSGEIELKASEKVKVTGYKSIEAEIVNVKKEVESPGEEVRKIVFDMEKFDLYRRTNQKETHLLIDDNQIDINLHDKQEHITIDDNNLIIGFNNDEEQIQLTKNLIKLITGQKVEINGAKEPLTLANTLIQMLNNVENQIMTLKNAWNTALASSAAMDGGKAGFGAGVGVVAAVSPLQFDNIKSTVTFSD